MTTSFYEGAAEQVIRADCPPACVLSILRDYIERYRLRAGSRSSEMPGVYESVESGCSVRTLPVKSDTVLIDGKNISIEELQRRYKLK